MKFCISHHVVLRPVEVLGAVAVQHVEGGRHGLVLAQALKIEAAQTFIRNIKKSDD